MIQLTQPLAETSSSNSIVHKDTVNIETQLNKQSNLTMLKNCTIGSLHAYQGQEVNPDND